MIEQRAYAISQQLHVGDHTVVYRGERTGDSRPVILKVLKTPHPAPPDIARLRHEYEVARRLDLPSVVRPLALEPFDQTMALVLEDFGGQSLDRLSGAADLGLILPLAVSLADTLGQIHQRNVIHKDVKPANIIANLATGEVKLTDFGIASTLSRETPALFNPNRLEGTVAYMSPEQTGRMNRALDYRTDFYSLGVTLYQLLAGELPFQSADLMELIHSHIAREAPPAHRLNGALPPQLSAIVARLLAKTAEERYQSAFGLKADLEECLRQWRESGAIESFPLGRSDLSERFQLPQRLYGREREVDALLAAFERARRGPSGCRSELLLVAGSSGVGKSSLVHEIHKPVVRERGYFASGKFDRLERSIPYSALIDAFRDLARQLLSEDEERLAGWRERLLAALAPNSRLISDAIPEVALIVGEQPAPPELPPAEAQHRFAYVFHSFVQVFAQPEHPLVMFLDDLQWADSASLKLIEQLLADRSGRALLLIGAYRDNETGAGHPLLLTLDALAAAEAPVSSISLAPLALDDVARLTADTLHADPASVRPIAEAVFQKTAGSPFFINQILQTLYERGALRADAGRRRWTWDEDALRGMQITDNVVELLAGKLRQLPPASGELLRQAACMGASVDLQTLALLGDDPAATVDALWPALSDGFLIPLGDSYKLLDGADSASLRALLAVVQVELRFAHDRVQQAAYSLLEPRERAVLHGRIGRLLLEHLSPEQREERVFDIANQLNFAAALLEDPAEREELARLNLRAGRKALASGAYAQAVEYLQAGLRLLPEDGWKQRYGLARDLHAAAAQAAYLNRDFAEMERLIALGLERAATLLEQVPLYEIRIQYHTSQNNMTQAVATAREVLGLLGVKLPARPTLLHVAGGLAATRLKLARTSIDAIKRLPPMADPEKLAALRILMSAVDGAYIAAPNLFPLIVFRMAELSLRHGNAPQSPFAYAIFAILMGAVLGDTPGGYAFGRFAIELMDQLKADELRAKVYVSFNITIRHWTEHLRSTLAPSLEGYASGLATGDIEYACHNAMYYCAYLLFCGEPLPAVRERQAQYAEFMRAQHQQFHLDYTTVYQHVSASLSDPAPLESPGAGIAAMLPRLLGDNNQTVLFCAYQALAQLHYLAGGYGLAAEHAKIARRYEQSVLGSVNIAQNNFYHSLALLGQAHGARPAERERLLWAVDGNQAKMAKWARHAPMNYRHKHDLVAAERARAAGDLAAALAAYDRAIAGARAGGFLHEEALANELAARCHLAQGRPQLARGYLGDARYAYERWGAAAVVAKLDREFGELFADRQAEPGRPQGARSTITSTSVTSTTGGGSGRSLDLGTAIKASRAIAGEIVLSQLLSRLMQIMLENAGAQRGALLLEDKGRLLIQAYGEIDAEPAVLQALPLDDPAGAGLVSAAIVNYVARTREPLVLADAGAEGSWTRDPHVRERRARSVLCIPLVNQGRLAAVVYLENNLTAGAFTEDRVELLTLLAGEAAISLENARLYANLEHLVEERTAELRQANQSLRALTDRLQSELALAQTIQRSLLPAGAPDWPGAEVASHTQPAREVGGDFFTYHTLGAERYVAAVGDVSGKGMPAALLMAVSLASLQAAVSPELGPAALLGRLDEALRPYTTSSRLNCALCYAEFAGGELLVANAGCIPPLIRRADGGTEWAEAGGLPLGVALGRSLGYRELRVGLRPGDLVVLSSDGIVEAQNRAGEMLGFERFEALVAAGPVAGAQALLDHLQAALAAFMAGAEPHDDLTLVVIRC